MTARMMAVVHKGMPPAFWTKGMPPAFWGSQ
eukprot:CAMPEP_0172715018 /NCGR_PEP_ID=MMETSP1074-20121228/67305_1 /TAXON_ID=2916 /ORGANISM="Ceratium fusus, Strain PA161109" /LENGTH=30 /DNA_ID= /DNA_START= /DNA_END= /DNA_ORIENTATION=